LIVVCARSEDGRVSERQVDDYLAALDQPKRGTLERLRETILEIAPEAEQGIDGDGVACLRVV
jgi:hypothetical protein